jgi:hypothetical protein
VFHVAVAGKIVTQMAEAVTLDSGVVRVPLNPRGWIDADALESNTATELGQQTSQSGSVSSHGSNQPPGVSAEPSALRKAFDLMSEGRQFGAKRQSGQSAPFDPSVPKPSTANHLPAAEARREVTRSSKAAPPHEHAPEVKASAAVAASSSRAVAAVAVPKPTSTSRLENLRQSGKLVESAAKAPPGKGISRSEPSKPKTPPKPPPKAPPKPPSFAAKIDIKETRPPSYPASVYSEPPHAHPKTSTLKLELADKVGSGQEASQLDLLNRALREHLNRDKTGLASRNAIARIQITLSGILRMLGTSGRVQLFGSAATGLKTGSSDIDLVFGDILPQEEVIPVLARLSAELPKVGFQHVTKVLQANIPIVKFMDGKSGIEVDFCIANQLGVRNSLLLDTYCRYDERVVQVGRLVKDWAKRHDLVGTSDGCLNSYAYMLLVIHYMQSLQPPVVPNLQALVKDSKESVPVIDNKWGTQDRWETKFLEDFGSLPPSWNKQSVGELLTGFFVFYSMLFDWKYHAVCMRLNRPGIAIDKFSLVTTTHADQWYIEDPFDLRHNLAARCSEAGRGRILTEMQKASDALQAGSWESACPPGAPSSYFLKFRITKAVTPEALLNEFSGVDLVKLHFPSDWSGQAFLEFASASARRRAHAKNEAYVADCQLHLHYSSSYGLAEASGHSKLNSYTAEGVPCATFDIEEMWQMAGAGMPGGWAPIQM